ncbi:MAG: hypothetical protein QM764_21075 [Chitinophagaceae bacterium]
MRNNKNTINEQELTMVKHSDSVIVPEKEISSEEQSEESQSAYLDNEDQPANMKYPHR